MSSVEAVVDAEQLSAWLDLQLAVSKRCLATQLTLWQHNAFSLIQIRDRFQHCKEIMTTDPHFFEKCHAIWKEMATIEKQLDKLVNGDSKLEKESYNEILFFKPLFQPLNFVPFFLTLWSTLRIYVLPGLSLLFPLITLLAPYLILRFVFQIPMNFQNYMTILQAMVSGHIKAVLDPSTLQTGKSFSIAGFLKQFGVVLITLVQGFIQPYWTYQHLKSIDNIIQEKGGLVLRFRALYQSLYDHLQSKGITFFKCPLPELQNERDATARVILQSPYMKLALKYVGQLEVLMSMAHREDMHPVHWVSSPNPVFRMKDGFDFQVPSTLRKTVSCQLDTKRHALLTGPNKGGKSTVLRALSRSALLAHTYGCSFGHLVSTPFSSMYVCLTPEDLPGSKSRFEREIEFTAKTLTHTAPLLIFIDELYHSTNPPDALRSCQIYSEKLWKMPHVISVISTHLFEWVETSPDTIHRLCCPAELQSDGTIQFHYELKTGICKVSSVDTLLRKNGMLERA
jgi:energy-coupling factor transporter ATP-binding protein EcfA2